MDLTTDAILDFMAIVMRNNVFHFGETCWIQKKGTTMGTLLAFFYVNVVMRHHKKKH